MQTSNFLSRIERRSRGLASGLIAFLIIWGAHSAGWLGWVEAKAGDFLRRQYASDFSSPIEIVLLDQTSLDEAQKRWDISWPWPRESYKEVLEFLSKSKAKAVVFDYLFTTPSSHGPDDDKGFARAIKANGQVFAGMQVLTSSDDSGLVRLRRQEDLYSLPLPLLDQSLRGSGLDLPWPPLWGAFRGVGITNFLEDADSLGRRWLLLGGLNGKTYPSLALSAAWELKGRPALRVDQGELVMGDARFPLGPQGEMNLLFRRPAPDKAPERLLNLIASNIALKEGGEPAIPLSRYEGKIVVIGSSASGLVDLRPSPLGRKTPGSLLQAMALDNLLSGQSLRLLPMSGWMWLALLLAIALVTRLSFSLRGVGMLLPPAILALALAAAGIWFYQAKLTLIPLATPLLGLGLAFVLTAIEHFMLERRQRARVQGIFGQFLSPAVLAKLGAGVDRLSTGGETKDLAVFFSDLAGFTSFSEKLQPQALVEILNEYLEEMAEVVAGEHEGYIDKYIGDAIMAFWGAPTPHDQPALAAAKAAWDCQRRLAEIQGRLKEKGLDAGEEGLVMRVGIHYGPCVVGMMGSRRKLNYTVMGDTVNTASRLEGANKPYNTRIMLSESARAACGDALITRVLDYLKVKGKAEPTTVHELVGLKGEPGRLYDQAYLDLWGGALALYVAGKFSEAKAAFGECLKASPKDGAARLFLDRCEHFLHEPPEGVWDGVYTMKTK